jgi:adenylate cyclase
MLGPRLAAFNAWLEGCGYAPMRLGVGVNSGAVMSDTVGSERRMEYAAVGMTRAQGGGLLVSGATFALLGEAGRDLVPAGEAPVRGRSTAVELWTLMPDDVEGARAA